MTEESDVWGLASRKFRDGHCSYILVRTTSGETMHVLRIGQSSVPDFLYAGVTCRGDDRPGPERLMFIRASSIESIDFPPVPD